MIPRINMLRSDSATYSYEVSDESEPLFSDDGFSSVMHCLVGDIEGLSPQVVAVEVAFGGIVSGTYPLEAVAMNPEQIAEHAVNTTAAVVQAVVAARGGR